MSHNQNEFDIIYDNVICHVRSCMKEEEIEHIFGDDLVCGFWFGHLQPLYFSGPYSLTDVNICPYITLAYDSLFMHDARATRKANDIISLIIDDPERVCLCFDYVNYILNLMSMKDFDSIEEMRNTITNPKLRVETADVQHTMILFIFYFVVAIFTIGCGNFETNDKMNSVLIEEISYITSDDQHYNKLKKLIVYLNRIIHLLLRAEAFNIYDVITTGSINFTKITMNTSYIEEITGSMLEILITGTGELIKYDLFENKIMTFKPLEVN